MQGILVEEFGGPESLRLRDTPDPTPRPGEVVVELQAAALNRRDTYVRSGGDFPLPFIPGSDGAGIRRDTGEPVVILPSLSWGNSELVQGPDYEILGGPSDGTYAELVSVPETNLFPKPGHLDWHEAAALPLAGLTAYRALFTLGNLTAGETILILGIGSGVSLIALALAVDAGARVVVTSSSPEKLERAAELGAWAGVDYTSDGWVERVIALTDGVDLVLDSVGATWQDSIRATRAGGRVVSLGATVGDEATIEIRPFYLEQRSLLGTMMGSPRDFESLLETVEGGSIRPVLDSIRPLGDAADAHTRIEGGSHFGKLVLSIG
jgi:zinc-binding alcohol dehydrogenase/oxidoreductase